MWKKGKFLFGAFLVVAAVGYLVYTGVSETKVYYLTIEEFAQKKAALADEGIRLAGRVQKGSVSWNPQDLRLSFTLGSFEDGKATQVVGVPVHYQGILPDMFAEGRDVIVEGRYGSENALAAQTIMTSCPSKYEPAVSNKNNS
jgi:cytochrome c-type biogenesis protein CcmE